MRRFLPLALLCGASVLPAQTIWDSGVQLAPTYQSYNVKGSSPEKISQLSVPVFVNVPLLPQLTLDVGTAFATVDMEYRSVDPSSGTPVMVNSTMSGLTDTQLRLHYAVGQDFVVLTAGVNLPTGSATVDNSEIAAATRIGSDFLVFPISGFGSGFGVTGGVAVARPLGSWNVGFGASVRHSSEYDAFEAPSGQTLKFQPAPEYRARVGLDHPFGTGQIAFGFTYSQYGDDKANAQTFSSGSRYIGQVAITNSLRPNLDYSVAVWNMFRASGTLIDQSPAPSGNVTNGLVGVAIRSGNVSIEPSLEGRLWTQQGDDMSFMGSAGTRVAVSRGSWALVPGVAYSIGSLSGASFMGLRASLGIRLGK